MVPEEGLQRGFHKGGFPAVIPKRSKKWFTTVGPQWGSPRGLHKESTRGATRGENLGVSP